MYRDEKLRGNFHVDRSFRLGERDSSPRFFFSPLLAEKSRIRAEPRGKSGKKKKIVKEKNVA